MIAKNHEKFKIFIKTYWQYFKELENEIIETRRYVDFLPDNYGTFSVEYLKLYQAICSEIDVIGKSVAGELDAGFKPEEKQNNIYKWWLVIQDELTFPSWNDVNFSWDYTSLTTAIVEFEDEQIIPWKNFRTEIRPDKNGVNHTEVVKGMKVPSWWSSYNNPVTMFC